MNVTFEEAKTILKRIVRPHVFVENEQWNVVCMKEEFRARFVNFIWERERLAYFSSQIVITFDLANKGATC